MTVVISDYYRNAESGVLTALDDLRYSSDVNDGFLKIKFGDVNVLIHFYLLLEFQTCASSAVCQFLYSSVVKVSASVEANYLDTGF